MIKAILFDVDGVLIDSFESNYSFYSKLLETNGYKMIAREEYFQHIHLDMRRSLKQLTQSESDEEIEEMWSMGANRVVKYPYDLIKMPESVEEIIKQISKKYRLGIVTSRLRIGVDEVPILIKLKKYFEISVTYEDTENHKPHPDPLLFGAKELQLEPSECIYIGDTQADVEAAVASNMKVITFPTLLENASGSFAHFNELPTVVKSLQ